MTDNNRKKPKNMKNRQTRPSSPARKSAVENKPIPKKPQKVQKRKETRPQKPVKKISTSTKFMIGIFVVLIIYGFGMFINLFTNTRIDSMVLKSIDVAKNDTYKGIIVREESLYTSEYDGYLDINARDLQKVKSGSLIYYVSKENANALNSELRKVNEEIFNLQTFREEFSNYKKEIDTTQNNIEILVDNFSLSSYQDINTLTEQINSNIEIRNQMIFADQRIVDESKVDTKALIQNKINENSNKVYAKSGGVVSYSYDELESTVNPSTMKDFTVEQTKMNSTPKQHLEATVAIGDNVLRIVESNVWYIASYIPAKDARDLSINTEKTLFIQTNDGFKEVPSKVYYVSENTEKEIFVIFELNGYMENFINKRSIDFALKTSTYMNMQVPTSALIYKEYLKIPVSYVRDTDQKVVIKKLEDNSPTTIPVVIDSTDATTQFYYLDKTKNNLLVGDILINPENAEENYLIPSFTKIPGVLKINNGTATFEKVEINTEIVKDETSDFVYILPSSTLKEYDRILTHAENAVEGEIIY